MTATALGALSCLYFFIEPRFSFAIADRAELVGLALFAVVGTGISLLAGQLYRSLISMARDITDRERMEKALRASEQRYRRFVKRNAAGVLRTAMDGRILECDDPFTRMLGYDSADELEGRLAPDLYFNPLHRNEMLSRCRDNKVSNNYETRFTRKDGSPAWALMARTAVVSVARRRGARAAPRLLGHGVG